MKKVWQYIKETIFPTEFMKKIVVLCWFTYVGYLIVGTIGKWLYGIDLMGYFDYVHNITVVMTISYAGKAGSENVVKISNSVKEKISNAVDSLNNKGE